MQIHHAQTFAERCERIAEQHRETGNDAAAAVHFQAAEAARALVPLLREVLATTEPPMRVGGGAR